MGGPRRARRTQCFFGVGSSHPPRDIGKKTFLSLSLHPQAHLSPIEQEYAVSPNSPLLSTTVQNNAWVCGERLFFFFSVAAVGALGGVGARAAQRAAQNAALRFWATGGPPNPASTHTHTAPPPCLLASLERQ